VAQPCGFAAVYHLVSNDYGLKNPKNRSLAMSSAFPQILVMGLFVVGLALFALWGECREHEQAAKEAESEKNSVSR
jgi:hypothetical protein